MVKTLSLILCLIFSSLAVTGAGIKGQLSANQIGLGFGAGFLGMIDIGPFL